LLVVDAGSARLFAGLTASYRARRVIDLIGSDFLRGNYVEYAIRELAAVTRTTQGKLLTSIFSSTHEQLNTRRLNGITANVTQNQYI
jgi:hypothetical protein